MSFKKSEEPAAEQKPAEEPKKTLPATAAAPDKVPEVKEEPRPPLANDFSKDLLLLCNILRFKRGHKSKGEEEFLERFMRPLVKEHGGEETDGGFIIDIKHPDGRQATTLFSCHVDTVHWKDDGFQQIFYDANKGILFKTDGQCLGADDGAGVWVLHQMIKADVPGCYIFHRGEEKGGIGSRWMTTHRPEFLKSFRRAVAFDRRGIDSVITAQRGGRCCSDDFGNALADALNDAAETMGYDFLYTTDDTGTFTDTANYIEYIPECTNVSVGYDHEHGGNELLDIMHVQRLADVCKVLDWEALPVVRKAEPLPRPKWQNNVMGWGGGHGSFRGADDDFFDGDDLAAWRAAGRRRTGQTTGPSKTRPAYMEGLVPPQTRRKLMRKWRELEYTELNREIRENPLIATELLFTMMHGK